MRLQLGHWEHAQSEYQKAIAIDRNNQIAQRRLADLYNLIGQRHQAVPIMQRLIGTPAGTLNDLFYLGDVDHGIQLPDDIHAKKEDANADVLIQIALGNEALAENRNELARQFFTQAINQRPNNPDAIAGLGQAIIHLDKNDRKSWRSRVTGDLLNNPGVLAVLNRSSSKSERHAAVG